VTFVATASKRVTARRLLAIHGSFALVALACAYVLPLLGRDAGVLEMLGPGAYDPMENWMEWRIARVLTAMLVGGALAAAGCALQALLRNPLAEPFTLGISSGSSLGAVLAIRFGLQSAIGAIGISVGALAGAVATLVVVVRLARIGRQLPAATLVLAGVTVSMWCSSISVLIQTTTDLSGIRHMLRWMMGSLDDMQLVDVAYAVGPLGFGMLVLVAFARELNALAAGPEAAASLGVAVGRVELVVFVVSSLLVGGSIALCGPIGFVGLIVPHVLRGLIGADHRVLLPASIFGGAILLALCDTLARLAMTNHLLPTGAVTAALGGPLFLAILIGNKRRAALWGRG
jgi:iron complex transport system permease protein